VYGDPERAYRHARLGEAQLGVAREVAPEDHAVEVDHESISLLRKLSGACALMASRNRLYGGEGVPPQALSHDRCYGLLT
jgi:hypothetical protein